jgi:hypothetical protein
MQAFLAVLGPHFRGVADSWQHFLSHDVEPTAELAPDVVRARAQAWQAQHALPARTPPLCL